MTYIVNTNQGLGQDLPGMDLQKPPKSSCTIGHPLDGDLSDSETVFVTTEDDGAGGTVTFVRNLKGDSFTKRNNIVETEYVIQDDIQINTPVVDNGKTLKYFSQSLSYQVYSFVYIQNKKIHLAEGMMDVLTSCGGTLKFLTRRSIFS